MSFPVLLSAVVPTWNGRALLERYLPSVLASLRALPGPWECIVVDDGSTDGTGAFLTERHPEVRVVRREQNRGFSSAVNLGINVAVGELVWLVNNDMTVPRDLAGRLIEGFREHDAAGDLFAVSALQDYVRADGGTWPGAMCRVIFEHGLIDIKDITAQLPASGPGAVVPRSVAFSCAGCALYRREKLLELGGFCEMLDPFYAEDLEVSLQAARRGWRQVFLPGLRVRHVHAASTSRKPLRLWIIPMRNRLLATWLLLDTLAMWRRHRRDFARALGAWLVHGKVRPFLAFFAALAFLPRLRRERALRRRGAIVPLAQAMVPADAPDLVALPLSSI